MFRHIVIPLDRTEISAAALPAARALAERTGATLALLHVIDRPLPGTEMADDARREARQWLRTVAQGLRQGSSHTAVAVRDGAPAEEILSYADENEADVICMATHGRTGLRRIVVGSVAERVLQHAPIPVLLVQPNGVLPAPRDRAAIVVPLDGSPRAEAALPYAAGLAKRLDTSLTLVRVWNTGRGMPVAPIAPYAMQANQTLFNAMGAAMEESVIDYLDGVAARLRGEVDVRVAHLRGDATEQLVSHLRAERPGLIVMGTHGRGGVPRWVLGSVAMAMVRAAVAPVLLVSAACQNAAKADAMAGAAPF